MIIRKVEEKDILESKKALETIAEIKNLAMKLVKVKHDEKPYLFIEGLPEIEMKMEKKLGEEVIKNDFKEQPQDFDFNLQDQANLDKLFSQHYINKSQLLKNINMALKNRTQITLKELLEIYPLEKGLSELVEKEGSIKELSLFFCSFICCIYYFIFLF